MYQCLPVDLVLPDQPARVFLKRVTHERMCEFHGDKGLAGVCRTNIFITDLQPDVREGEFRQRDDAVIGILFAQRDEMPDMDDILFPCII